MTHHAPPNMTQEHHYWGLGDSVLVGIDEVGKGAWAGPLTIGAFVLPKTGRVNGVRDSKMLTHKVREKLFGRIDDWAQCWSVGHASARECDELGMSDAQRLATRRALNSLPLSPDRVLLDGNWTTSIGYLVLRSSRVIRHAFRLQQLLSWLKLCVIGLCRRQLITFLLICSKTIRDIHHHNIKQLWRDMDRA